MTSRESFAVRIRADFENDLLARGLFEEAVDVVGGVQIAAVHREDVISGFDVDAGLGQRGFIAGIPVFAVVDFGNAIAAVFQAVIGAEQTAFDFLRLGRFAAADEHVADRHLAETFLK